MTQTAYIALGANLGEPRPMLRWAVQEIARLGEVAGISAFYQTAPVGGPPGQPDYLNAALRLETDLSPQDLLAALHDIEHQAGRERKVRWGARVLDLDLIVYGDLLSEQPELLLPHPRAWERAFVLAPLADLQPDLRHPVSGETVAEALARVRAAGITRVEEDR